MSIPSFHQRDDVHFDIIVYADRAKTTPKDVSGATVTGRIGLKSAGQTDVELTGSVLDGPTGSIRIPLTSAESEGLDAVVYDFQAEVLDQAGDLNTVVDQKVRCKQALPDI